MLYQVASHISTPRIARRGCLKHVDAAMFVAWMEKMKKNTNEILLRGIRTIKSRHGESQPNEPCAFESMHAGPSSGKAVVLGSRNTTIIRCRAATAWVRFSIGVDLMFVRFSLDFR